MGNPFWNQIRPRRTKMSPREPLGAAKSQKTAFTKRWFSRGTVNIFSLLKVKKNGEFRYKPLTPHNTLALVPQSSSGTVISESSVSISRNKPRYQLEFRAPMQTRDNPSASEPDASCIDKFNSQLDSFPGSDTGEGIPACIGARCKFTGSACACRLHCSNTLVTRTNDVSKSSMYSQTDCISCFVACFPCEKV